MNTKKETKTPPANSPEEQLRRSILLANTLAERQLLDGSASPSIVLHFLKEGSESEQLEIAKKREEIRLLQAKTDAIKRSADIEKSLKAVIDAVKLYSGVSDD